MLQVRDLHAGYGRSEVLRGISFDVKRGEIVTIVGGFATALALARASDLIATVPERHTAFSMMGPIRPLNAWM